jgi:hypothetical protein
MGFLTILDSHGDRNTSLMIEQSAGYQMYTSTSGRECSSMLSQRCCSLESFSVALLSSAKMMRPGLHNKGVYRMKRSLGLFLGLLGLIGFISAAEAIHIQQAEIDRGAVVVRELVASFQECQHCSPWP